MTSKQTESMQSLTAGQLLELARQVVPELKAEEAKARLDRGEFDLVLDVREPDEWLKEHLPIASLAGGFAGWATLGFPVEQGTACVFKTA